MICVLYECAQSVDSVRVSGLCCGVLSIPYPKTTGVLCGALVTAMLWRGRDLAPSTGRGNDLLGGS